MLEILRCLLKKIESSLEPKFQKFIGFLINSMAEFFQTEISDNAKKKKGIMASSCIKRYLEIYFEFLSKIQR